jgi:hypothetical protein
MQAAPQHMNTRQIVWKGILPNTMEYCTIEESDGITVTGYITGKLKEIPLHCAYALTLDNQWNVQSVHITLDTNQERLSMAYAKQGNNWCDAQGAHLPALDGCTDIDISLTPFTNSLPINRLHLPEGASKEITVVYFNLPAGEVKPATQKYTRLDKHRYRYENPGTGFTSVIETDEDGFVINYPGIWQRVYP